MIDSWTGERGSPKIQVNGQGYSRDQGGKDGVSIHIPKHIRDDTNILWSAVRGVLKFLLLNE